MTLEDSDAPVAFSPANLQLRRFGFDKRGAHALLTLDNDPLRSIRSEDLEKVATTTTATHLLKARESAQIVRHNVMLHRERKVIRRYGGRFRCADERGRKRFSKSAC
ncbi:hypothetical protein [Paraburkholderia hospita]|uniref:hypothetical protein n=1 Tax=Paraburkholderia hospita TaxID=169430 RepID=UPI0013F1435E|nr:hypothetical protein [Paraburkholderia hospita]